MNIRSRRLARRGGLKLDWTPEGKPAGSPPERLGDSREGTSERENRHGGREADSKEQAVEKTKHRT